MIKVYGAAWSGRQLVKLFNQIGSNPIWTANAYWAMAANWSPKPKDKVRFLEDVQKRV